MRDPWADGGGATRSRPRSTGRALAQVASISRADRLIAVVREAPDDAVAWIEAAPTGEPTIERLPLDAAHSHDP